MSWVEFFEPGLPNLPPAGDTTNCANAPTNRRSTSAGHARPIYAYDFFFSALDLRFGSDLGGSLLNSSISGNGTSKAWHNLLMFAKVV